MNMNISSSKPYTTRLAVGTARAFLAAMVWDTAITIVLRMYKKSSTACFNAKLIQKTRSQSSEYYSAFDHTPE